MNKSNLSERNQYTVIAAIGSYLLFEHYFERKVQCF